MSTSSSLQVKRVVLAYSGGLDTSIIIPWLRENYGCEVIAMVGNVGQGDDYAAVRRKALASGAAKVFVEDLREEFVTGYLWKAVKAGTIYESKYLLGTSLARPLLAMTQVKIALEQGADALAHGCTGKGNDQVRFELAYQVWRPNCGSSPPGANGPSNLARTLCSMRKVTAFPWPPPRPISTAATRTCGT